MAEVDIDIDRIRELNNFTLENYSPETIQVEDLSSTNIAKQIVDDNEKKQARVEYRYDTNASIAKEVERITRQATTSPTTTTSRYTTGINSRPSYMSSATIAVPKSDLEKDGFEYSKDRFDKIRKQAYEEADRELKAEKLLEKESSTNPHLDYIKSRHKKTSRTKEVATKIVTNPILKQSAIIVGIFALNTAVSFLHDEYRDAMKDARDKRKEKREERKANAK